MRKFMRGDAHIICYSVIKLQWLSLAGNKERNTQPNHINNKDWKLYTIYLASN